MVISKCTSCTPCSSYLHVQCFNGDVGFIVTFVQCPSSNDLRCHFSQPSPMLTPFQWSTLSHACVVLLPATWKVTRWRQQDWWSLSIKGSAYATHTSDMKLCCGRQHTDCLETGSSCLAKILGEATFWEQRREGVLCQGRGGNAKRRGERMDDKRSRVDQISLLPCVLNRLILC